MGENTNYFISAPRIVILLFLWNFRSDNEINELEDINEESDQYDSEAYDDVGSLNMDDTKSRFTDYSMSSSIIRRNENLKLLDDQFEQVLIICILLKYKYKT